MSTPTVETKDAPTVPHDHQCESAVIGSVFMNRDAIGEVGAWLEPSFFDHPTNRAVYQAIHDLWKAECPTDFQTVGGMLEDRGQIHMVGDRYSLTDYINAVPTAFHVAWYAERVYKKAIQRMTIEAGRDIASRGYQNADDTIFADINAIVERVSETRRQSDLKSAEHTMALYQEQAEAGGVPSVATGLYALDQMLGGGFHPGEMIILAARPGVGKSWGALAIMHNIVRRGGRVLYVTYEMPAVDIGSRMVALESGVGLGHVRKTALATDAELIAIAHAQQKLAGTSFWVNDDFGATMDMIEAQTRMEQGKRGAFDLIIVDYLQLIEVPKEQRRKAHDSNRQSEVSQFSRGVKRMAGTLGCPVLALSQLNRAVEGRATRIPMLSDLRESGSLEQDSDVVMFIDREEMYKPDTARKGIADFHIAKQRNGELGRVSFGFNPATGRFTDTGYQRVEGY